MKITFNVSELANMADVEAAINHYFAPGVEIWFTVNDVEYIRHEDGSITQA